MQKKVEPEPVRRLVAATIISFGLGAVGIADQVNKLVINPTPAVAAYQSAEGQRKNLKLELEKSGTLEHNDFCGAVFCYPDTVLSPNDPRLNSFRELEQRSHDLRLKAETSDDAFGYLTRVLSTVGPFAGLVTLLKLARTRISRASARP